jgi:SAM-dependent methyltransferase
MERQHYLNIARVEETNWWYRGKRELLTALLTPYIEPGMSILDVGCGTGRLLEEVCRKTGARGYGIEPDKQFAALAARSFPKNLYRGNLDSFVGKGRKTAWPVTFDVVLCVDTLEHIRDDRRAISRLVRLLKSDGLLVIFSPAFSLLWSRLDIVSHHYRRYTAGQLRQLTDRTPLSITRLTYTNCLLFFPIILVRLLSKIAGRSVLVDPTGLQPLAKPINELFYRLFFGESFWLRYLSLPVGSSILMIARKKSYAP